jgi:iron complex transport system substrate-binding protein
VVDRLGRPLDLPHPPQRIISLTPSATEVLFALGLDSRIVAVTGNDTYPPQALSKPRVGDINPDYERLVALHPDLIVLEGPLARGTLARLDSLHLPTLALDSGTMDGFHLSVRVLAQATNTTTRADKLLADMDRRIAAVETKAHARPETQWPRVFVEVSSQPLMTASGHSFMVDLLHRAGGENCFPELTIDYPQVSPEALVQRDPDVVILTESKLDQFKARPGFGLLTAVREGHVYAEAPPDPLVRPTFRMADEVEHLYSMLSVITHQP